jgi:hypothetical protein
MHLMAFVRGPDYRSVTMRNHDFVSGGLLAVTAVILVLLCSGLLAIAFA